MLLVPAVNCLISNDIVFHCHIRVVLDNKDIDLIFSPSLELRQFLWLRGGHLRC